MEDETARQRADRRDTLLLRRLLRELGRDRPEVTEEEVAYFRAHPDEIDAASAPARIHRLFLLLGTLAGLALVALSRIVAATPLERLTGGGIEGFVTDVLFEIGVALIGAAVTAYLLGVLLTVQQRNARIWRQDLRARIAEAETKGAPRPPPGGS